MVHLTQEALEQAVVRGHYTDPHGVQALLHNGLGTAWVLWKHHLQTQGR